MSSAPLVRVIEFETLNASCKVQPPPTPLNVIVPVVIIFPADVMVFPVAVDEKVKLPERVLVIADVRMKLPEILKLLELDKGRVDPVQFKLKIEDMLDSTKETTPL